jgi:SAM-dependent methyltransferase
LWIAEYNQPFAGWDFSYLNGRRVTIRAQHTWDYTGSVVAAIEHARSLLEMDTGGGEALAALPRRPPLTCATEGYGPNVPVARQRLGPLGVEVVEVHDPSHLPFADGRFDVVTNRHGAYEPREVRRVLAEGGLFITQQVGSQTNRRLHELLGDTTPVGTWNLAAAVHDLEAAGLHIVEQREEVFVTRFHDVSAIVYYLKAVPWEIPDFSVDRYFDKLVEIHALIQSDGYVDVPFHQFFIRALRV